MSHWTKPEEMDQTMAGLYDLRELIGSGLFQLDNETESEMLEADAISMDTEEISMCLDDAIAFLEMVKKL